MPKTTRYGVSGSEVKRFVDANSVVKVWVQKFRSALNSRVWLSGSRLNKARVLCRFFKWLSMEKNLEFSPEELLNKQLVLRQSKNVKDRQWLLSLVLAHTRDNLDFKELADMRKYVVFTVIKSFCDYHEVALTTAKGIYGRKRKKKNHRKQIDIVEAKRLLDTFSQRDRTICLIQLVSGMEISAVLEKFSFMWFSHVKPQLDSGCDRLKIEFDERKANGTWYYTYVSQDAIHELRKYLEERRHVVERLLVEGVHLEKSVVEGEPIFITRLGTPLRSHQFTKYFTKKFHGKVVTHMFRILFKTEASVLGRGIDKDIVKFWMGRAEAMDRLDAPGSTYDRNPELREHIIEREYMKFEPYINIYSGEAAHKGEENEDLRREVAVLRSESQVYRDLLEVFRDPKKLEKLNKLLTE